MRRERSPGTRFRLFPEYASGYVEPETVSLSPPPGTIGPGPCDAALHAVYPLLKSAEYVPPDYMPPYCGPVHPPVRPGPGGHFDHIPVDAPDFLPAHLYGCVRRTLDVWEGYLGRRIVWWHAAILPRLELVPVVQWPNAHSGPGFIETGIMRNYTGRPQLFCLNFDVVAHETGHAILFSQIGVPQPGRVSRDYLAFHESFSDLIGLIAAMHFPSVLRRLLRQTGGNLYALNLLNRLGELSDREQVRIACNETVMADVDGLVLEANGNWTDPEGHARNQHAFSEPLTGAIFDILVEIYQDVLVARGAIPAPLDARGWDRDEIARAMPALSRASGRALARFTQDFLTAIETARSLVGRAIAHVVLNADADTLTFALVAAQILEALAAFYDPARLPALADHFLWRGIDPRPFLSFALEPAGRGRDRFRRVLHAYDPRGAIPCRCNDPLVFVRTAKLIHHPQRAHPAR